MRLSALTKAVEISKKLKLDLGLYQYNIRGLYVLTQSSMYGAIILLLCLDVTSARNTILSNIQFLLTILIIFIFFSGLAFNCLRILSKKMSLYARIIAYYMFPMMAALTGCIWFIGRI
jgi:hypothetical protein